MDTGFLEQLLEGIMNGEPTRFLCNLGIQYIIGDFYLNFHWKV